MTKGRSHSEGASLPLPNMFLLVLCLFRVPLGRIHLCYKNPMKINEQWLLKYTGLEFTPLVLLGLSE
jgi:hypothetical protein